MWHLTGCKSSDSLLFLNEMIFYRISELMLPTWIQRHDKKIISFLIQFKNERLTEILQAVRRHIFDRIDAIYQFIQPFLERWSVNFCVFD